MKNKNSVIKVVLTLALSLYSMSTQAGGPLAVTEAGVASVWDDTVALDLETGACGNFTNGQMVTKVTDAVDAWDGVTGITDLLFDVNANALGVDVTTSNYTTYFV